MIFCMNHLWSFQFYYSFAYLKPAGFKEMVLKCLSLFLCLIFWALSIALPNLHFALLSRMQTKHSPSCKINTRSMCILITRGAQFTSDDKCLPLAKAGQS